MRFKTFMLTALCLCSAMASVAQEGTLSQGQVATLQEKVRGYLDRPHPEFAAALPLLVQLHDNSPKDVALNYALGYCYINMDDDRALPYFEFCLKFPKEVSDELYYYTARAFHLEMKFDKAIEYYDKFKETIKKPEKHQDKINELLHEVQMCRNGIKMMETPKDLEVFNMGDVINSEFAEYGPIFNADGDMMIFTSCRPDTKGGKIDKYDGRYFEDIYMSRKSNDTWSIPMNMGDSINTDGNDAVVAMSPDGQKIYIYRYAHGNGDLYVSKLIGETWGTPEKLPEPINSESWEPSMSITPDENVIYFTSDRPGGLGGTDIYVIRKLPNGSWAQPMNLGAPINTKYNEDSPFILSDGKTLYFSSNSDLSMGGYDVFTTQINDNGKWSKPENLGYPISTPHDDLYFSFSADGEKMYFSSLHTEGKGDKDIYFAKIKQKTVNVMLVNGHVIDAETKQPIMAHIEVTEVSTGEIVGVYNSNQVTGNYTIIFQEGKEYSLEISSEGYRLHHDKLKIPLLQNFQMIQRNFKLVSNAMMEMDLEETEDTN